MEEPDIIPEGYSRIPSKQRETDSNESLAAEELGKRFYTRLGECIIEEQRTSNIAS